MTKTQLVASLSESTGPPEKRTCRPCSTSWGLLIERHIKKRAVGTFTLPGLLRIVRARKPARKARTMISPRSGEGESRCPAKRALDHGQGTASRRPQADGRIGALLSAAPKQRPLRGARSLFARRATPAATGARSAGAGRPTALVRSVRHPSPGARAAPPAPP